MKVNVGNLGGDYNTSGSLGNALYTNGTKYVNIDLSGSTFTSIGNNAFYQCGRLTGVTIPNGVTSIGDWAFRDTGLTSVTIPSSVTTIENSAFMVCDSLTSVTIGSGVTTIGYSAFSSCTSLTSVTFETGSNIISANFGDSAFPQGSSGFGGNNLRTAYLAAMPKAGTYTRPSTSSTAWTKTP